jgi:hypothetical protein
MDVQSGHYVMQSQCRSGHGVVTHLWIEWIGCAINLSKMFQTDKNNRPRWALASLFGALLAVWIAYAVFVALGGLG